MGAFFGHVLGRGKGRRQCGENHKQNMKERKKYIVPGRPLWPNRANDW